MSSWGVLIVAGGLEDFDWRFNPTVPRKDIYELAACHFVRQATDVPFVGPPGAGKTHLAQAIGYEAIKQGFLVRYRSIFDLVAALLAPRADDVRDHLPVRFGRNVLFGRQRREVNPLHIPQRVPRPQVACQNLTLSRHAITLGMTTA